MVFSPVLIARYKVCAQIRIGRRKKTVGAINAGKLSQQKPESPKSK
jgi:hypothetical protein